MIESSLKKNFESKTTQKTTDYAHLVDDCQVFHVSEDLIEVQTIPNNKTTHTLYMVSKFKKKQTYASGIENPT